MATGVLERSSVVIGEEEVHGVWVCVSTNSIHQLQREGDGGKEQGSPSQHLLRKLHSSGRPSGRNAVSAHPEQERRIIWRGKGGRGEGGGDGDVPCKGSADETSVWAKC